MYKTLSSELIEYNYGQKRLNGNPLNIVVAAGPFTFDDGFGYEPFKELLLKVKQDKPDLLILVNFLKELVSVRVSLHFDNNFFYSLLSWDHL